MALPAQDDFNRADGNLTGGNWTLQGTGNLAIAGNTITPARSGNPVVVRWSADTFPDAQKCELTLVNPTTNGGIGPAVRVGSASVNAYFLHLFGGTNASFLGKIVAGGAVTQIGGTFTATAGSVYRLEAEGNSLRVYQDDALQFTQTDSSLASGWAGLYGNDFDDTAQGDDFGANALVIYQYARPASTVSNAGSWVDQAAGTTNLHTTVDETTIDTADYIQSPSNPAAATIEFALGSLTDPASSDYHTYSIYARKPSTGAPLSQTVALYQGATLIRTDTVVLSTVFAQYDFTLTAGEADSITNYGDLRVRLLATQDAPATPVYVGSGVAVWTATSGTALNPLAPAGTQADDSLLLIAHTSSNVDFTDAITGWTKIATTENNTTAQRVELWRRIADGTSADNPTVAGIATATVRGARVIGVRGSVGAPTVSRSNNAASATVTFAAANSGAVSLSVLLYAYEDDPSAIGTVSGFTAFDVDVSALGTDAAIGTDATRANSGAGSKAGGTANVSGGTFANSVNVGIHAIFDAGSANVSAQVAWVEFKTPEATGGGTTPVGSDAAQTWHTRAAVGATALERWHTRAAIGASAALAWAVRIPVASAVQPMAWNVRAAVAANAAQQWHTRAAIGSTALQRWHTRAAIGGNAGQLWHVRSAVGRPAALGWHVRSTVGALAGQLWHVRATVGSTAPEAWAVRISVASALQPMAWHVRAIVGRSAGQNWHTRAAVGSAAPQAWNVLVIGFTAVGSNAAMAWHARAVAGRSADQLWHARAAVGRSADQQWRARALVGSVAPQLWHARAVVGASSAQAWAVRTSVGRSAPQLWHLRAAVGADAPQLWDVLFNLPTTVVGSSAAMAWAVRAAVGAAAGQQWRTRAIVGRSAPLAWHVRVAVFSAAPLGWAVRSTVAGQPAPMQWHVRALVSAVVAPQQWRTRALAGAEAPMGWAARALVARDAGQLWHTRALAGRSAPAAWAVRQLVPAAAAPMAWHVEAAPYGPPGEGEWVGTIAGQWVGALGGVAADQLIGQWGRNHDGE